MEELERIPLSWAMNPIKQVDMGTITSLLLPFHCSVSSTVSSKVNKIGGGNGEGRPASAMVLVHRIWSNPLYCPPVPKYFPHSPQVIYSYLSHTSRPRGRAERADSPSNFQNEEFIVASAKLIIIFLSLIGSLLIINMLTPLLLHLRRVKDIVL